MSSPGTCATRSGRASRWSVSIAPIAFELVTAILQLDAPGHDSTSAMVMAPGCPRPMATSSRCSSATRQVGTKRITRFCSLLVRIDPSPNLTESAASARNWAGEMSPFGKRTITDEKPACFWARTFVFANAASSGSAAIGAPSPAPTSGTARGFGAGATASGRPPSARTSARSFLYSSMNAAVPSFWTTHLIRALCLSLRLPSRWNVRTTASETSRTSVTGRNSCTRMPALRSVDRPPPM